MEMQPRKPYPTDQTNEEWAFACLMLHRLVIVTHRP